MGELDLQRLKGSFAILRSLANLLNIPTYTRVYVHAYVQKMVDWLDVIIAIIECNSTDEDSSELSKHLVKIILSW